MLFPPHENTQTFIWTVRRTYLIVFTQQYNSCYSTNDKHLNFVYKILQVISLKSLKLKLKLCFQLKLPI